MIVWKLQLVQIPNSLAFFYIAAEFPQISIFAPVLFYVYTSEKPFPSQVIKIRPYAVDMAVWISHRCIKTKKLYLNLLSLVLKQIVLHYSFTVIVFCNSVKLIGLRITLRKQTNLKFRYSNKNHNRKFLLEGHISILSDEATYSNLHRCLKRSQVLTSFRF